jgi:hypothetical protein
LASTSSSEVPWLRNTDRFGAEADNRNSDR